MKIVVISPTYNEKINIEKLIPLLEESVFPKVKNHDMHLLIVDDNSPDGTASVVEEAMKKWKNVELLKGEKNGLGAAYVRGIHHAMDDMRADAIMEFDADFQHDPADIPRLIEAMDKGADQVIGSRYVKGGGIPKEWGIHRKIISRFGGLFAQLMFLRFDVHDMTAGYKLTKTSFLKNVDLDHLYSKYYAYKLHILHDVLKQGAKVTEVPILFYERKEGSSKITRKDLFDSFWVVIRLRINDSKSFFKFLVVGGTGFVINAIILKVLSDNYGWDHSVANLAGAAVAIFSNYNFNNLWTFSEHKIHGIGAYFLKLLQFYATSAFGVIFIQTGIIWLGDHTIGEGIFHLGPLGIKYYYIYFVIGTGLLLIWNFFIYNKFIWKKKLDK